jgi:hypothetical protein
MTAVMRAVAPTQAGPRWVRFALVERGRIVDERVRGPERAITVGSIHDVDVPCASLAGAHELLVHRDGEWVLRLPPGLTGKVREGALEELAGRPDAAGWRELALSDDARARVDLGGNALLIQLVDRPPARSKPRLPASLAGGAMERADWWFTAFVAGSFLVHFGLVAFLSEADWPVERALIPDRFVEAIFMEPPAPEDPPPMDLPEDRTVADDSTSDAEPSDAPSDRPSTPRPTDTSRVSHESGGEGDPSLADANARDAATASLVMLGAIGDDGSAFDALRDGPPLGQSEEIFAAVDGATPMASNESTRLAERDRAGAGGPVRRGLGALAGRHGNGDGPADEGTIVETIVRPPHIGIEPPEEPPYGPDFDRAELLRAVRARMTAIRRCYERELAESPDLSGRLLMSMRVMPVGTVAAVHASENSTGSTGLAACASRSLATVRVRQGPDSPVEVEYPIVFSRQD